MSLASGLDAALVAAALAHFAAVVGLLGGVDRRANSGWVVLPWGLGCFGTAAVVAMAVGFDARAVWLTAGAGAALLIASRAREFRASGAVTWVSFLLMTAALAVWGLHFLVSVRLSNPTRSLLWATVVAAGVALPSSVLQTLEGWETLLRRQWNRVNEALVDWVPPVDAPMVSIHVPAHAEPPDLVIETLDVLAQLDYPNYEVLVIDNNTTDEGLWRPVVDHCRRLGPQFRFLHVEGITGAKAGALNWARHYIDPRAELIAVVDADYHVDPRWLAHTVGHFDDPTIGFVQCPHAYRDYHHSQFATMANIEYSVFFATSMVALSEHGAGLTVGTMSIIRRRALDDVGGWAEWCLTEDSELAIRIHAAGYASIYLTRPYGWGLIPETFAGYKKQRFRWTYGPVQEFKKHAKLFLPGRLGAPSQLSLRQRIHHANHGLDVAMIGLRLLAVPIAAGALISMIAHHETIPIPFALWTATTVLLVTSLTMRWLVYRRIVGVTLRKAVGGVVAFMALSHIISVASLCAVAGRDAPWQRTDKFRRGDTNNRAAFQTARTETILAAICLTAAIAAIVALPHRGIALAIALGLAWQGLTYLAAPAVAAIAQHELGRQLNVPAADLPATS